MAALYENGPPLAPLPVVPFPGVKGAALQWFLVFTALVMIALAFLGFTNFSHALPLNDKMLHFICLMLATGVFYFIFDVEE